MEETKIWSFYANTCYWGFLWCPPPTAADAAIEELMKARLKRHYSTYIIVILEVMKHRWIGKLYKAADIVFELKSGHWIYWPSNTRKLLIIGIFFLCFVQTLAT